MGVSGYRLYQLYDEGVKVHQTYEHSTIPSGKEQVCMNSLQEVTGFTRMVVGTMW